MRFSATPRQRACVVESMLRMGRGLKTDTKLCPFLVKYVARLIGCQALISSPKKAEDTHQKRFHKNNLVPIIHSTRKRDYQIGKAIFFMRQFVCQHFGVNWEHLFLRSNRGLNFCSPYHHHFAAQVLLKLTSIFIDNPKFT